MYPFVNIVTSDRGWILERLAQEIVTRLSYVRYSDCTTPKALITYYITYSCRQQQVSPLEMAYFAHLEPDPATNARFFTVAGEVQHCICHAERYATSLREQGITNVTTINPGVDLNSFVPKLRIGVVGRTYHTGRKGEALVAQLMDMEWIDWYFTGEGWPGPPLHLADAAMPDFYRSMDYILVPSLYEGGPMCVAEALACGTKVIAPPVGWVPQFPHISYKTGDAEDLRSVLMELYQEKCALRESVEGVTWDAWAEGHDHLFRQLAGNIGKNFTSNVVSAVPTAVVLHGSEKIDKGGPTARAPRMAQLLRAETEYAARLCHAEDFFPQQHALTHVFNLHRLETCKGCVDAAYTNMKPVILSPIFLDLSEKYYFDQIKNVFRQYYNDSELEYRISLLQKKREMAVQTGQKYTQLFPGYFDTIRDIVNKTDHVICLSEHEKSLFAAIDIPLSKASVIRNPVDATLYASAPPNLFYQKYGVRDYILCVGRLETRKNQLMLAYALKETDIPLVFIGHGVDQEYAELLRRFSSRNTLFIGRLEAHSPMLAAAYAEARVYCLPSWAEGASLSALEAAASGCTMVLSNRSSELEYFGDYARYCDPFSLASIRDTVMAAYEAPLSSQQKKALQAHVAATCSWDAHIEQTAAVYEKVLCQCNSHTKTYAVISTAKKLYIDVTSSANRNGPPSGIARVEYYYAKRLYDQYPDNVQIVLWNGSYRTFVPVRYEQLLDNSYKALRNAEHTNPSLNYSSTRPYDNVNFQAGSVLLIMGGAWITNTNYSHDVQVTASACKLHLGYFIHDIIQAKFTHWFPDGVGERFSANCKRVIEAAGFLLANSQCTADDVLTFANTHNLACPPVNIVRFGDDICDPQELAEPDLQPVLQKIGRKPFVLCVSALDIRKNHALLHNVWRKMLLECEADTVPHLICVGSKGWNIDNFLDSLARDPIAKNHVHIFHNIEDETLDWLYRQCLFTVYPSFYEGWGLPVAESLAYGKICIAAAAGSVPEICSDYTDLIDPYDFCAWYAAITRYAFRVQCRERREAEVRKYKTHSWETSSKELFAILQKQTCVARNYPHFAYDNTYSVATAPQQVAAFLAGGWGQVEKDGVWTVGTHATMLLRLWMGGTPAVLCMCCRCDIPDSTSYLDVEILINSTCTQHLCITQGIEYSEIIIPQMPAERGLFSDIRIDFVIRNPYRPCGFIEKSIDSRLLGFFMQTIAVRHCSEDEIQHSKVLQQIDDIIPQCGNFFYEILKSRPDITQAFFDKQHSAEKLIFWAWRYGCHEQLTLAARKENFLLALQHLHAKPYGRGDAHYSMLVHALWLSREDLHTLSPDTTAGQQAILLWFDTYGVEEYNLHQIVAGVN